MMSITSLNLDTVNSQSYFPRYASAANFGSTTPRQNTNHGSIKLAVYAGETYTKKVRLALSIANSYVITVLGGKNLCLNH